MKYLHLFYLRFTFVHEGTDGSLNALSTGNIKIMTRKQESLPSKRTFRKPKHCLVGGLSCCNAETLIALCGQTIPSRKQSNVLN